MHSDRNGEGGAGPVEQPLTWDDENVAAPECQGFFLYKNQMLISLMPATNLRGVIFLLFFAQVVAKAIAAYTQYEWLTLNITKSMQRTRWMDKHCQ